MKRIFLISLISGFAFGWSGCTHLENKNSTIRNISSVSDFTSAWSYGTGPKQPDNEGSYKFLFDDGLA